LTTSADHPTDLTDSLQPIKKPHTFEKRSITHGRSCDLCGERFGVLSDTVKCTKLSFLPHSDNTLTFLDQMQVPSTQNCCANVPKMCELLITEPHGRMQLNIETEEFGAFDRIHIQPKQALNLPSTSSIYLVCTIVSEDKGTAPMAPQKSCVFDQRTRAPKLIGEFVFVSFVVLLL
jgi:hypothetical protein